MKIQIIIFLFISYLFSSCNQKEHHIENVIFNTGFEPRKVFVCNVKSKKANEFSVYFAEPVTKKIIKFFDLNGEYKDSINLKPIASKIANVENISVISRDTILMYFADKIIAINRFGTITHSKELPLENTNGDFFIFGSPTISNFTNNTSQIILYHDWRYNKNEPDLNFKEYYANYFEKPMYSRISDFFGDSINVSYSENSSLYKEIYSKPKIFLETPKYIQLGNEFYAFSLYSNKIFKFNINDFKLSNSFIIESQYTSVGSEALDLIQENSINLGKKTGEIAKNSGRIGTILHNSTKNEFYVLIYHKTNYQKIEDISLRPFSIIKYNKEFIKIKEIPFTNEIYKGSSIQFTPKGLMLLNKKESTDEELHYDFFDF